MQSYFHIHPEAAAASAQIMTRPVQVDMMARKRSKSPSNSSLSQARPEEDWTKITDLAERRRIQNRIAQRNYRKKLKRRLLELENRASSPETDSPPNLNMRGVSLSEEASYSLSRANTIAEQTNTKRRSMSHLPPRTPFDNTYEAPRRQDRRHTMLSPPTNTFYNLPETSNHVHYLPKAYNAAIMPVSFSDPTQIPYDHYSQMSPNFDPSHPFSDLRISPDIVELATDQDLLWTGEPSWQHPSWEFPEEHASLQYVHDWNIKMAASPASEMTRSISSHTASKQESDISGGEDDREPEEGLYGIKNELLDEDVLQWADFWKEQQLQEEFPQNRGLSP